SQMCPTAGVGGGFAQEFVFVTQEAGGGLWHRLACGMGEDEDLDPVARFLPDQPQVGQLNQRLGAERRVLIAVTAYPLGVEEYNGALAPSQKLVPRERQFFGGVQVGWPSQLLVKDR